VALIVLSLHVSGSPAVPSMATPTQWISHVFMITLSHPFIQSK
jgi:hypothetical protein